MNTAEHLEKLLAELRIAIPETYAALKKEFPDLCGFAVCTTTYVESIVPIYQRTSKLPKADHGSYALKKYFPAEWNGGGDKVFSKAAEAARADIEKLCNDRAFAGRDKLRKAYVEGILAVLIENEQAGGFGPRSDDRYLTLWLAGDDEEWILKAAKKLNAPSVHKAAAEAFGG